MSEQQISQDTFYLYNIMYISIDKVSNYQKKDVVPVRKLTFGKVKLFDILKMKELVIIENVPFK